MVACKKIREFLYFNSRNVFLNDTQQDASILIVGSINYGKSYLLDPFNSRSKKLTILAICLGRIW